MEEVCSWAQEIKKGLYTVEVDEMEYEANKASAQVCPVKIIRINRLNK